MKGCLALGTLLAAVVFGPTLFAAPPEIGYELVMDPAQLDRHPVKACVVVASILLMAIALIVVVADYAISVRRAARRTLVLLTATSLASAFAGPHDLSHSSVKSVLSAAAVAVVLLIYWYKRDNRCV